MNTCIRRSYGVSSTTIPTFAHKRPSPSRQTSCRGITSSSRVRRRVSCDAQNIDSCEAPNSLPILIAAATGEFALIAVDLMAGHKFAAVDLAIHDLVLASTSEHLRDDIAAGVISNLFPAASFGMISVSTVFLFWGSSAPTIRMRVCVAWGVYVSSIATVGVLKEVFARPRPSADIFETFAFPSGHTCTANVLVGLTLFVLLDPVWDVVMRIIVENRVDCTSSRDEHSWADFESQNLKRDVGAPVMNKTRIACWIFATCVTAVGRIEGNRHWLSDTMGGAALGMVFVYLSLICIQQFEDYWSSGKEA